MKKMICLLLASTLSAGSSALLAQEGKTGEIVIKEKRAGKAGSSLSVDMKMDLSQIEVPSNRSYVYTPLVTRGDSVVALPSLVLNGRDRHILYERTGRNPQDNNEFELRRLNGKEQTFDYHASVPMRKWMEKSDVSLVTDICGCGWEALQNGKQPLFPVHMAEPVVLKPLLAFVTPQAEAVKERAKEGSAFLDFPVNKIVIYPEYRKNPSELQKIRETVESVRNDKYATITEVSIKGYASPEGSYSNNTYLADNRARALRDYVKGLYDFKDARFTIEFEPEDWAGLERMIEESGLPGKAELLAIIHADEPKDWDKREHRLKTVNAGSDYKSIMSDIYPALRHSDYVVKYTIRNFSVDEAKELIYTDPKQLSLNEMFQVAQTYEPGSDRFNEVFEIAVRMYPDDPVSNLNAALTAISANRTDAARRYLAKVPDSPQKRLAEASVKMLEGDLDGAESLLNGLEGTDVAGEAARNLEQIRAKREE